MVSMRKTVRRTLRVTGLRKLLVAFRHRGLTDRDVLVASYPRSGSTWLRFLLFEVLTGNEATFAAVNRDLPYIGGQRLARPLLPGPGRLLKTHEPAHARYRRAVYLVRDPRDVVASEFTYQRGRGLYSRSRTDFIRVFLEGRVHGFGSWRDHVRSWLSRLESGDGEILLVRFEDLKAATDETLHRVLDFIQTPRTAEAVTAAIESNRIQRMRAKEDRARESGFRTTRRGFRHVGRGDVGGWQEALEPPERRLLEAGLSDELARLGYQL